MEASARDALAFGRWLAEEGFQVTPITDEAESVTHSKITDAVEAFVRPGTYHQLVIYFSGHGFWKNDAELWLLTDAPGDANAAVSWTETAEFAKDCGIPSVVLISDACRTIPNTPRALKVRGSIIFPNDEVRPTRGKVDKFMGAAVGTSTYEIGDLGKKESVFTRCFLRAFAIPDRDMMQTISEDGQLITVIPNRKLGRYLQREVASLLASVSSALNQTPDAEVLSDDDVYIGRVRSPPRFDTGGDVAEELDAHRALNTPTVHIRDVASMIFKRALGLPLTIASDEMSALEDLAQDSGFTAAVVKAGTIADNVPRFETNTGFTIVGAAIADAIVANGERPIIRVHGNGNIPGVIQIEQHLAPASTVVLRFTNDRGAALAALNGFIGHVTVQGDRIANVSYVPSDNTARWSDYVSRREQIERLRSAASAAAQFGVFRLNDQQTARTLLEELRLVNGLDPTLGLYAAYAYSESDRRDDINSILGFMTQDLRCQLFDVAMLGRTITKHLAHPTVPFCPMLAQGWNLLRARNVVLPDVLDNAQDELEPALWTTFKPARTQAIFDAIQRGEIR